MTHAAPRGQNTPPPGSRPAPLLEVAGPQAAVTVGHMAAEAPSLVVASVAEHDGLDDATVQFLLQKVLRARAEDEMVAKEQTELDQLVGDLAVEDGELLAELQRERGEAVRITRDRRCLVRGQGEGHEVEGEERKRRRKRVGGRCCLRRTLDFWETTSGLFSCMVRQWIHVWCFLVYFYGPLHLAFDCSTLCLKSTIRDYSGR